MMQNSKPLLLGVAVALAAAGAWSALSNTANLVRTDSVEIAQSQGTGVLDGMTFAGEVGVVGKPADIMDTLVFSKGMFVSTECERRCNYPASAYFAREKDGGTEFITETRCPNKDAKLVWRGTVKNDKISGTMSWTSKRWYWTVEKEFWFKGTLISKSTPLASAE